MFTKNDQIPNYVLDSFALLAHFQAESGGEKVKNLLDKAVISEVSLYMSIINMGEVFYITSRNFGNDTAHSQMSDIRQMPIKICGVTNDNVMAAASLKAKYKFSFCDAFAASLAQELQAIVVTGDPEFEQVKEIINIEWLVPPYSETI